MPRRVNTSSSIAHEKEPGRVHVNLSYGSNYLTKKQKQNSLTIESSHMPLMMKL